MHGPPKGKQLRQIVQEVTDWEARCGGCGWFPAMPVCRSLEPRQGCDEHIRTRGRETEPWPFNENAVELKQFPWHWEASCLETPPRFVTEADRDTANLLADESLVCRLMQGNLQRAGAHFASCSGYGHRVRSVVHRRWRGCRVP